MSTVVALDVPNEMLTQLESQQTPLRIQGHQQSYYVLTVDQLLALMQPPQNFEDDTSFTPEEFGLTEADIAAYEANQQKQRAALPLHRQQPPDPELFRRLDALPRLERLFPQRATAEREVLLRELEVAMLNRLQALIPETE